MNDQLDVRFKECVKLKEKEKKIQALKNKKLAIRIDVSKHYYSLGFFGGKKFNVFPSKHAVYLNDFDDFLKSKLCKKRFLEKKGKTSILGKIEILESILSVINYIENQENSVNKIEDIGYCSIETECRFEDYDIFDYDKQCYVTIQKERLADFHSLENYVRIDLNDGILIINEYASFLKKQLIKLKNKYIAGEVV